MEDPSSFLQNKHAPLLFSLDFWFIRLPIYIYSKWLIIHADVINTKQKTMQWMPLLYYPAEKTSVLDYLDQEGSFSRHVVDQQCFKGELQAAVWLRFTFSCAGVQVWLCWGEERTLCRLQTAWEILWSWETGGHHLSVQQHAHWV